MIEKLDSGEFRESVICDKLNELIDGYNELRAQLYPLEATIESDFSVTWKVNPEWRENESLSNSVSN